VTTNGKNGTHYSSTNLTGDETGENGIPELFF